MKTRRLIVPVDVVPDGQLVYVTGTRQVLRSVHEARHCAGVPCVVHRPSDHAMRKFPTHWRADRKFMERICPHGVGHPDPDQKVRAVDDLHGCDGCCGPSKKEVTE